MSIQKRDTAAGVRYVARYRGPDKKERSRTFERRKDAKAWIEDRERDVRRGEWIDPVKSSTTIANAVTRWEAAATRPNTRKARTQLAKNLGPYAEMPLHSFGTAELRAWNKTLLEGRPWKGGAKLSPSTVATMRGQLLGALEMARENGEIRAVPSAKKLSNKRQIAVSPKEIPTIGHVLALAEAARHDGQYIDPAGKTRKRRARPQTGTLIEIAASTGMRANELLGLRPMDVDFLRREIHPVVQSAGSASWQWAPLKSARSHRVIPVTGETIEALSAEHAANPVDEDGPIFRTSSGAMVQYPLLQDSLAMCRHDANVPERVTMHSLRHHYASRLIAAGVPVSAVSAALGHSSPSTTLDIYTHLLPGSDDLVRAALVNRDQNAGNLRDGGA